MSGWMTLAHGHCVFLPPGLLGGRSLRVAMTNHRLDIKAKRKPEKGLSAVFIGTV